MRNASAYLCPGTLDEAIAAVQAQPGRAAYLAGGTALAERDDPRVETLVDLAGLGLDRVEDLNTGIRIGAMVTLERLRRNPQAARLGDGILGEALGRTRTEAWRNQATLGGRLRQAFAGDLVKTALLTLDARVTVQQFPHAPPETIALGSMGDLDPGALLLAVEISSQDGWSHALESLHLTTLDRPIVAVGLGLRLEVGRITAGRVATCGLAPSPVRASQVENTLRGATLESDYEAWLRTFANDMRPTGDWRGSSSYRAHLGQVLLGRAFRRLHAPAGEA